jgi:hypothetical protein
MENTQGAYGQKFWKRRNSTRGKHVQESEYEKIETLRLE